MAELYHHVIMDHYCHPRRRGKLTAPSATFRGTNPLCGDVLVIDIKTDRAGVITAVAWRGEGCAISQAAASWWCDSLVGKKLSAAQKTNPTRYLARFAAPLSPGRIRCAVLPLVTLSGKGV